MTISGDQEAHIFNYHRFLLVPDDVFSALGLLASQTFDFHGQTVKNKSFPSGGWEAERFSFPVYELAPLITHHFLCPKQVQIGLR